MKPPQRRKEPTPAAPDALTVTLDEVIDGSRPGRAAVERDELWLALRSEIRQAELGTEFDLRRGLTLSGEARAQWQAAHRAWLADRFRDDPRVDTSQ